MQFGGTVLYVDDVLASVAFYQRAFGLLVRFSDDSLGYTELETGGPPLALASHSLGAMLMADGYARAAAPAGVEIAFLTSNVPESFGRALAAGASPLAAPKRMPWGPEVAYLRAPDGTMIGLSEPPPSSGQ